VSVADPVLPVVGQITTCQMKIKTTYPTHESHWLALTSKMASRFLIAVLVLVIVSDAQVPDPGEFHWDAHQWQELSWKQSISRRDLPAAQKSKLIDAIVLEIREYGEGISDTKLRDIAAETRIAFLDLSGHGRNEVIAQGGACSPTGNCAFWVLQRKRDAYHVILSADSKQTFTVQPTKTNGFHDLVLGMHGSAFDAGLTLYKFDGSEYRDVDCYEARWEVPDEKGEFHHLKEPRITLCGKK
jgi:hypothetical protein